MKLGTTPILRRNVALTGLALLSFGFGLMWSVTNFWAAVAVLLLIWGNNFFHSSYTEIQIRKETRRGEK